MKMVKIAVIFSTVVVLVLPCVVEAIPVGTVDIAHTGYGAKDIIKIWGGGYSGVNAYAGIYMLNKTGGTGQGNFWLNGPVGSFCLELPEAPSSSTLTYDVVMTKEAPEPTTFLGGPMGAEKAEYLRELWGRFFDPLWVGSGPFTNQQKSDAEAFTAAIWEIVYEDLPESPSMWDVTADGTTGELGFRCENADTTTANDWLHDLDGTGPKANLRVFSYNGKQDYIVEVPELATIALLGLGGLVLLRRRCA